MNGEIAAVLKINGENEPVGAGFVESFHEFIIERADAAFQALAGCEEYSQCSRERDRLFNIIKERVGFQLIDSFNNAKNGCFSIEQKNVYLKGLCDGYMLCKLLEKGATLTYKRRRVSKQG